VCRFISVPDPIGARVADRAGPRRGGGIATAIRLILVGLLMFVCAVFFHVLRSAFRITLDVRPKSRPFINLRVEVNVTSSDLTLQARGRWRPLVTIDSWRCVSGARIDT